METKGQGALFADALRGKEKSKIDCGKAHFAVLAQGKEEHNPARYLAASSVGEVMDAYTYILHEGDATPATTSQAAPQEPFTRDLEIEFPWDGREERVYHCLPALIREYPEQSFLNYGRAILLATNPEQCKRLLRKEQHAGFDAALAETGLSPGSFQKTAKFGCGW